MSKERDIPLEFEGEHLESVFVGRRDAQPRPTVMMIPTVMGVSELELGFGRQLVELGFNAFVADLFGKEFRGAPRDTMFGEMKRLADDRPALRKRLLAVLDQVRSLDEVDSDSIVVSGYCFGGMCALELARSGAPLKAVVTFHGSLAAADPADAKNIKASVLALHGADDPYVKADEVKGFADEMRAANVDWQLVQYSGAVHSFTDTRAGNDNSKGTAYNALADKRSWQAMKDFLAERLAK